MKLRMRAIKKVLVNLIIFILKNKFNDYIIIFTNLLVI